MHRLAHFEFDLPDAAFPFSRRLARENGWSHHFTLRVIEEYKRFLILCCDAGHPVTPSDHVDQAWHLHLCYTRSYWEDLCRDTLGKPIHHGPTKGGNAEDKKFTDWYQRTLTSYQKHFGQAPPDDIWPPSKQRFARRDFRRIDASSHLIISRKTLRTTAIASAATLALAGCTSAFVQADPSFLVILAIPALFIFGIVCIIKAITGGSSNKRHRRNQNNNSGCGGFWIGSCGSNNSNHDDNDSSGCSSSGCSSSSSGCGGGGCGGGD